MALLKFASLPRSTFYYYLKAMDRPDKYEEIKAVIQEIYHAHKGRYGYRRITLELHNRGYRINHKTVLKLMGQCNIKCQVRIRKYRAYKRELGKVARPIFCNVISRQINRIRNGLLTLLSSHYLEHRLL